MFKFVELCTDLYQFKESRRLSQQQEQSPSHLPDLPHRRQAEAEPRRVLILQHPLMHALQHQRVRRLRRHERHPDYVGLPERDRQPAHDGGGPVPVRVALT